MILLARSAFREAVFSRDRNRCVICGETKNLAAHHILDRKFFGDGGYYLDNGASLCEDCHLKAESSELSCSRIRAAIGIRQAVLPFGWSSNFEYDKWGHVIGKVGHDE